MDKLNIVEILKVGPSGLVFLLSALSYWLLVREQKKANPNAEILRSIRLYMCSSVALAMLTFMPLVLGKFADSSSMLEPETKFQAIWKNGNVRSKEARVCNDSKYNGRYISMKNAAKPAFLVQVHSTQMPCEKELNQIAISEEDARQLGFTDDETNPVVVASLAPLGFKFIE